MHESIADKVEKIIGDSTGMDVSDKLKWFEDLSDKLDLLSLEKPGYTLPPIDTIGARTSVACLKYSCNI